MISFGDKGKLISVGPPYLPIIPFVFSSYGRDYSNFNLYLNFRFDDSIEVDIDRIIFIIDSNKKSIPIIKESFIEKDFKGERNSYLLGIDTNINYKKFNNFNIGNYTLQFNYNLDSIKTMEIIFDSIKINNEILYVEPLRLKLKKVLCLRHEI
jgi:hypothetical protein